MRLKYQLRGLGIGIIITAALLMGFSDDEKASAESDNTLVMASVEEESNEEVTVTEMKTETQETVPIILREESTEETESLSDVEENTVETESEFVPEMSTVEETTEAETETSEKVTTEIATEEAEKESTDGIVGNTDVVEIRIVSGDDSGTVARKLQIAGLVENASEYDAYLMQHGYDKKISVGTVEIAKGSTWLEIAEKISGR